MPDIERYKRSKVLGSGAFGKVWLVHSNDAVKKGYAMKVLKLEGVPTTELSAMQQELRLLEKLKHPNIVGFRESFKAYLDGEQKMCIVMDLADGGDLGSLIKRTKKSGCQLNERKILRYFVQIGLGVQYMHYHKVMHRDIKAANIFLAGNGRIVLGDFGVSKKLDSTAAMAQTCIGTPYYMAPELFADLPYTFSADIWALGVVLYELMMLRFPFQASTMPALAMRISRGNYKAADRRFSYELRAMVKHLLHRNPSSRPTASRLLRSRTLKSHISTWCHDIFRRPEDKVGEGTKMLKQAMLNLEPGDTGCRPSDDQVESLRGQLQLLGLHSIVTTAIGNAEGSSTKHVSLARNKNVRAIQLQGKGAKNVSRVKQYALAGFGGPINPPKVPISFKMGPSSAQLPPPLPKSGNSDRLQVEGTSISNTQLENKKKMPMKKHENNARQSAIEKLKRERAQRQQWRREKNAARRKRMNSIQSQQKQNPVDPKSRLHREEIRLSQRQKNLKNPYNSDRIAPRIRSNRARRQSIQQLQRAEKAKKQQVEMQQAAVIALPPNLDAGQDSTDSGDTSSTENGPPDPNVPVNAGGNWNKALVERERFSTNMKANAIDSTIDQPEDVEMNYPNLYKWKNPKKGSLSDWGGQGLGVLLAKNSNSNKSDKKWDAISSKYDNLTIENHQTLSSSTSKAPILADASLDITDTKMIDDSGYFTVDRVADYQNNIDTYRYNEHSYDEDPNRHGSGVYEGKNRENVVKSRKKFASPLSIAIGIAAASTKTKNGSTYDILENTNSMNEPESSLKKTRKSRGNLLKPHLKDQIYNTASTAVVQSVHRQNEFYDHQNSLLQPQKVETQDTKKHTFNLPKPPAWAGTIALLPKTTKGLEKTHVPGDTLMTSTPFGRTNAQIMTSDDSYNDDYI